MNKRTLAIISLPAALVLGEVDLGTTALIGTTAFVVMFVAGANPLWLGAVSFAGLSALLIVATQISERMGRLSAFLHTFPSFSQISSRPPASIRAGLL